MTRVQPLLVNQFTRLLEMAPRFYKPGARWNDVVHGHNFDAENCMASMGAVAASAQTGGIRHFSPADIRNNQDDFSGGIGHDDVQTSFARLGLPAFIDAPRDWAANMAEIRAGRFVWWAVQYAKVPRPVQAQKGGTFDHALGGFNMYADGTFDLYDPLADEIQRVEQSAIRPAAEAIALRERGDASRLFVGATNVLPSTGLTLRPGAQKTAKYPDRQRANGKAGQPVNVHSKPRTGAASVVGTLADGALFVAYQVTLTGDPFDGTTHWYGDRTGTRWVSAARLVRKGGST